MKPSRFPWIFAGLPWIGLFCLFLEMCQAAYHFGHLPKYLRDPDPFHNDWAYSPFQDALSWCYLLLPFLLIPWAILLFLPRWRYSGPHRVLCYFFAAGTAALALSVTLYDVTGLIEWRPD